MKIGSLTGPYRLLRHLGSGGMGEVWLAQDTRLDRQVALKMVRADGDTNSRARLMKEARAAAALNHPHIATVHDVLEHDGEIIVVFEYVEGETLHAKLARGPLEPHEAVDIATQITKALAAAHAQGIVHRDLKPANVIIGTDGHVKVLDFGIARILSSGTTQTNPGAAPHTASVIGFVGTASYAAPEQMVSSAVDERADLYALGVVMFEMITGERPFKGSDPVQLARKKLGIDAPPLSSGGKLVPDALEQLVAALLERDCERRPATANDVLRALKHVFGGSTKLLPPPRPPSRWRGVAIAAAALIVLLSGFGAWKFSTMREPAPRGGGAPVVAVLPLTNVSGDATREFVAAGIAESLIASLATIPSITVLSRNSVVEAKNRTKDTAALTKDLGANYRVEGSVQESSGKLKVSLTLVKSADGSVAWGEALEGTFEQIFDLQSRLASALTSALVVRVSASELERINHQPTSNPQALAAYWQGRTLMERRDLAGNLNAAIEAFTRATTLDPKFATAFAALGEAYWQRYVESRDQDWVTKAMDAGLNALRLAPDEPQVRFTLALTLAGSGKLDEAVAELRKTLAIQPNYEDARRQLGIVLAQQGRIDEAKAEFQRAIALRPMAWGNWSSLGASMFQAGRYPDAVAAFTKVTELQPDNMFGHQQLGAANQMLGRYDEALASYQRVLALQASPQTYSNIGAIHHVRGDYGLAVDAYQQSLALRPNSHVTWRNLGDSYTKLDRKTDAVRAYQRAIELTNAELKINPSDASLLSVSAVYLAKVGRVAEADARIGAAVKAVPSDAAVHFRRAEVFALSGRNDRAIEALQRSVANGMAVSRIRDEEDFASLRKLAAFDALLKGETR